MNIDGANNLVSATITRGIGFGGSLLGQLPKRGGVLGADYTEGVLTGFLFFPVRCFSFVQ